MQAFIKGAAQNKCHLILKVRERVENVHLIRQIITLLNLRGVGDKGEKRKTAVNDVASMRLPWPDKTKKKKRKKLHNYVSTHTFSVLEQLFYPTDCEDTNLNTSKRMHAGGVYKPLWWTEGSPTHNRNTWDRLLMWAVALQWWQKRFNSWSKGEVLVALRWSRWCLYESVRWSTGPLNLAVCPHTHQHWM